MTRFSASTSLAFTARVVKGAGRGRTIGAPTLNLSLNDIPQTLRNGIYACRVVWNRRSFSAAMHFGPRPVFKDTLACEVHIIGHAVRRAPMRVRVEVVKHIRHIRNFPSVVALQRQIARDVAKAQRILRQG